MEGRHGHLVRPHSWCCAEPCPAQLSPRGRAELSCPQAPTATPRPLQATFFPLMTSSPVVLVPLPPVPAPLRPGCRLGLPAQLSLVSLRAATQSPEFLYSPCPSRKMIHKKTFRNTSHEGCRACWHRVLCWAPPGHPAGCVPTQRGLRGHGHAAHARWDRSKVSWPLLTKMPPGHGH